MAKIVVRLPEPKEDYDVSNLKNKLTEQLL